MATRNRFFSLADNTLNQYGLFCGYVDRQEMNNLTVKMFHDCGVFAVQVFDDHTQAKDWNDLSGDHYRAWFTFENSDYAKAKKLYRKLRKLVMKNKAKELRCAVLEQINSEKEI